MVRWFSAALWLELSLQVLRSGKQKGDWLARVFPVADNDDNVMRINRNETEFSSSIMRRLDHDGED